MKHNLVGLSMWFGFAVACGDCPPEEVENDVARAMQYGRTVQLDAVTDPLVQANVSAPEAGVINWLSPDELPHELTVHLGPVVAVGTPGKCSVKATAIVMWGVDGGLFQAEVDFVQGCTFTIFAEKVQISARNDSQFTAAAPGRVSVPLKVSAALGFGSVSTTDALYPTRTMLTPDLSAGGVGFTIPAFAKSVDFVRFNQPASSFRYLFFDAAGTDLGFADVAAGADLVRPVQIPQGAVQLSLVNLAGTTLINTIFGLAL